MSIFQIKNTQFKKDIVESLQLSQKDPILKWKDGQIPLSKFATVMELIEFLRRGELANEGCPKNIQKIIYFSYWWNVQSAMLVECAVWVMGGMCSCLYEI